MYLVLHREWPVMDASKKRGEPGYNTTLKSGRHEVERITNPSFPKNGSWLVVKGTKIGASEQSWRQWADYDNDFKVTIEE